MKINKAYKIRLYPTIKQQKLLKCHFGAARWVYNYFLQYKTDQHKLIGKSATFFQLCKLLTEIKTKPETAWLTKISRQCAVNSLHNLDSAFNNFFRKITDYPTFKKRFGKQSYRINYPYFIPKSTGIHIPLLGIIKCEINLPANIKLYSATVSRSSSGRYFVAINYEMEIPDPVIDQTKLIIGLDFGLKNFITTSDGIKLNHSKPLSRLQKKLKKNQRKFSRRVKTSKRRAKQRHKISVLHEKIANRRSDFLHKLSSKMIDENQAIYLEDLNLDGMKKRYGKQLQDLGWREFTNQLTYKGSWYGCHIKKIDRFFPSSKICNSCNYVNNGLILKDREWDCNQCHTHHDRDINAAKNILTYGRADRNLRTGRVGVVKPLCELSNHQ